MLRTRIVVGSLLVVATVALLVADQTFAPDYPLLLGLMLLLAWLSATELVNLLPQHHRPAPYSLQAATVGLLLCFLLPRWLPWFNLSPVETVLHGYVALVIAFFLVEMARYRQPGETVVRLAISICGLAYLGILPGYLMLLRVLMTNQVSAWAGTVVLFEAIFVAKSCDIGAYFTGRFLGKHRMAPALSPKKTWEGAAGGLALAVVVAAGFEWVCPLIRPWWLVVPFGLTVGLAGMLGDLAESLIKRDLQTKDASQVVPGFGGLLDVVDSILFAAPLTYAWFRLLPP